MELRARFNTTMANSGILASLLTTPPWRWATNSEEVKDSTPTCHLQRAGSLRTELICLQSTPAQRTRKKGEEPQKKQRGSAQPISFSLRGPRPHINSNPLSSAWPPAPNQDFNAAVEELSTTLQREAHCTLLTMTPSKLKELHHRELDHVMHQGCDAILQTISKVEGTSWKLQALHKVHTASAPSIL